MKDILFNRRKNNYAFKTDIAAEFAPTVKRSVDERIAVSDIRLDEKRAQKINRPKGRYCTLETDIVAKGERDSFSRVTQSLTEIFTSFDYGYKNVLVAALGNPDLTADALGDRVFKRLNATRHLNMDKSLCCIAPNVMGVTGIESYDIIFAVTKAVKPDLVIAVDALTASATERLGTVFQITDVGITPGSGVSNHRRRLDSETLGCKVISAGVPLVVYGSTIANDYSKTKTQIQSDIIVTPKDIDMLVDNAARVLACAINRAFSYEF